ncbi:hypothetical protein NUW58_g6180 [Xylaria curta]|uniref:Uncharacterized protein n=1 Tax=Xylaria curta TaxID=42375 RepID=A0ACC1NX31_9PEZI|nr:hypothetical protein NUW58_g6180 [Xylaria curta]
MRKCVGLPSGPRAWLRKAASTTGAPWPGVGTSSRKPLSTSPRPRVISLGEDTSRPGSGGLPRSLESTYEIVGGHAVVLEWAAVVGLEAGVAPMREAVGDIEVGVEVGADIEVEVGSVVAALMKSLSVS